MQLVMLVQRDFKLLTDARVRISSSIMEWICHPKINLTKAGGLCATMLQLEIAFWMYSILYLLPLIQQA